MKYKKTIIYVDYSVWDKVYSLRKLAKRVGCNYSYLSRLRRGKNIATEEFYNKVKKAVGL